MEEFKTQIQQKSRWPSNGELSPNGDGIQAVGRSSHKMIEAVMQSASKGKVGSYFTVFVFNKMIEFQGNWNICRFRRFVRVTYLNGHQT